MNAVVEQLRRGPRTTGELALATGLSRNAVECAIRRARTDGCRIINGRSPGDRRGALYMLIADPRDPRRRSCVICGHPISRNNLTSYCREHLPLAALIAAIEADLAAMDPVKYIQLELVW